MIDKDDPRLTAYLLDELDDDAAAEVQAAIEASDELREHVEGLRQTIGILHESFRGQSNPELTSAQLAEIDAAASDPTTVVAPPPQSEHGRVRWRNFALAGLVLYAIGISIVAFRKPAVQLTGGVAPSVELQRERETRKSAVAGLQTDVAEPEVELAESITFNDLSVSRVQVPSKEDEFVRAFETVVEAGVPVDEPAHAFPNPELWSGLALRRENGSGGQDGASTLDRNSNESPFREFGGTVGGQGFDGDASAPDVAPSVEEMMLDLLERRDSNSESLATGRDDDTEGRLPNEVQEGDFIDRKSLEMGRRRLSNSALLEVNREGESGNQMQMITPRLLVVDEEEPQTGTARTGRVMLGGAVNADAGGQGQSGSDEPDVARKNTFRTSKFKDGRMVVYEWSPGNPVPKIVSNSEASSSGDGSDASPFFRSDGEAGGIRAESDREEIKKRRVMRLAREKAIAEKKAKEAARQKELERIRTWKPASASANRARLSVGHHDDLALSARDTYVRIDGFRARVFFDCYYYNDRPQQLEGQFLLRLPSDASLHYFAFGPANLPEPKRTPATGKQTPQQLTAVDASIRTLRDHTTKDGSDLARRAAQPDFAAPANTTFGLVKTARVVPRQKAALAYEETVRRRVDPALVEWAGPGIFQTKVFPLLPNKLHRIVVGYDVMLVDDGDDRVFKLDLPEGEAGGRVEFDVAAEPGTQATVSPATDAFISNDRAYYKFENAEPRDYTVRLAGARSVVLNSGKRAGEDAYFATRIKADLPDEAADLAGDRAVFLLDTSWSDRPAAFSRRLKLLRSILEENRDDIKQFAVMMFNVEQRWWRTEFTKNNKKGVNAFFDAADRIALEGATDLHSALSTASTAWYGQDASTMPNYFLLSDAAATWGRVDMASLADPIRKDASVAGGALFAYHLAGNIPGHTSDRATMQWLAGASGGAVFDVAEEAELAKVAVAHRSRPWQMVGVSAKGADEILIQGAARTVYPGQTLTIAGRGRLDGPLEIQFQRGGEKRTLKLEPKHSISSPSAARLFGQLAVEKLEPHAAELEEITIAFARYFRVPGRTCSMVMLESAEDYERFGVKISPADDQLVIASTSVSAAIGEHESELRQMRQQSLKRFTAWVDSLQAASLVNVPTAMRLAMKRLPDKTFGFDARPLKCKSWAREHLGETFADELDLESPGFEPVMAEAERKRIKFGADDAIKTASTLVEAKPSDVDTLRSVAFRAIEWQRSDQAAPLLWRLAQARPYQPQCLLLLARAMSESDDTDSAIICYDLVCHGNWNDRWASGAKDIAQIELMNLLEQVASGEIDSAVPQYCRARLRQLRDKWSDEGLDMAVVMHWNTDRTDVDLHVTEPGGEVCYYKHNATKSGGRITQDITQGLGPEMYTLKLAPAGEYVIDAKYYSSDNNRTKAPTETLLTVFHNLGRRDFESSTNRITLSGKGEKQTVMKVTK